MKGKYCKINVHHKKLPKIGTFFVVELHSNVQNSFPKLFNIDT